MKEQTFTRDSFKFLVGQKVECFYYHEYDESYMEDAYKRTLREKLFDKPFKPVKLGVIVGDAGTHPYWLGCDRTEQYLLVKFKEYRFAKPIPISCIRDARQSAESMARFLKENEHRVGEKGYDLSSFEALKAQADKARNF